MTAEDLFTRARTLVDDDNGDFTTPEYLLPKIQLALDWVVLKVLNNPNMGSLKTEVVIPNVPAGTKTFASYFTSTGPLALLSEVISLRERPASGSRNEQDWIEMDPVPNLPATQPTSFNRVYLWTMDDIKVLGADQATDLRVFGKFTPVPITAPDTPVPANLEAIMAYKTASIIAKARGNAPLGADYAQEAKGLLDDYFANAIMAQQAVRIRNKPFRTFLFPYR